MKLVAYRPELNPEYLDQVVDALMKESPEFADTPVERNVVLAMITRSPHIRCLIHAQEGTLLAVVILSIGPLWYAPKRTCARDLLVWVAPLWRGSSLGPRLVRWIESWAEENGVDDLYLCQSTGIAVERTAQFYERMGFTLSGFISHKRINHVHRI